MAQTEISDVLLVKDSDDNDAMKRLMAKYKPIVYRYSSRIDPLHMEDSMQDGYIGLLAAAKAFDPDRGNAFSTFAFPYIKGFVLRGLHGRRSVKHPSGTTLGELSKDKAYLNLSNPVSLEELECERLGALSDGQDMDRSLIAAEIRKRMKTVVSELRFSGRRDEEKSEFARKVIFLHYGLEGARSLNRSEIAKDLGITEREVKGYIQKARKAFLEDSVLSELYESI